VSRKNSKSPRGARVGACGARTLACRVHTRVNASAPSRICTRPRIFFPSRDHPSLHRIVFDIRRNAIPFHLATYPMIVGLALPELLAGTMQQPVCSTRGSAFQRFEQQAGRNRGQQKQMDVIRHDNERPESIVSQLLPAEQRLNDQRGNCFTSQMKGAARCRIEKPVYPRESFAVGDLVGRRKMRGRQAAVHGPGKEQPTVVGIDMGEAALGRHAMGVGEVGLKSRVHTSVNAARKSACATSADACATGGSPDE